MCFMFPLTFTIKLYATLAQKMIIDVWITDLV